MNINEPTTSCCVCYKEIPVDAAFTPEGGRIRGAFLRI